MKFNFKKLTAGALLAMVLIPGFAFADFERSERKEKKESIRENNGNFCSRISSIEQKLADQITKAEAKQSTHQSERLGKIEKKESDIDSKRAIGRAEVDGKRVKNWNKMLTKASTDREKAAVEAYKTAISTAVTARRASVDNAIKAYRDGLTLVLANHKTAMDAAVATFKTSLDTAIAKAKADCAGGIDSKIAKETFNKSSSDAKKALQTARKNAETSSGLTALKKTRNDAINAAVTTFKAATEKARADLLLVLKK